MEAVNTDLIVKTDIDFKMFKGEIKCSYVDVPNAKIREV